MCQSRSIHKCVDVNLGSSHHPLDVHLPQNDGVTLTSNNCASGAAILWLKSPFVRPFMVVSEKCGTV